MCAAVCSHFAKATCSSGRCRTRSPTSASTRSTATRLARTRMNCWRYSRRWTRFCGTRSNSAGWRSMGREPRVTRIGLNTQGVFSDVLGRTLPNGWSFGLPNEVYLTKDGKAFDGPGVPPDVRVPFFSREELESGRDAALDKAMETLGAAGKS